MVIWRRFSIFNGKKIPLYHHRSNLDISQQAGTEWLDTPYYQILLTLPNDKGSEFTPTQNFCSLLSVWLLLSHDAKPTEKRFLISWEHRNNLNNLKPSGIVPTAASQWGYWAPLNFSDERKVTKKAQLGVHHPDAWGNTVFKSLHAKIFSPATQAVRWHWTAAVSLLFPHPLSFRDRMYLNSRITFSQNH